MDEINLLVALKELFAEEDWPWVIPALRQDSVVWQTLINPDFCRVAIQKLGNQPQAWSPLNLALLTFEEQPPIARLQQDSFEDLPARIQKDYQQVFDRIEKQKTAPETLKEFGLLAIYRHTHPGEQADQYPTAAACQFNLASESAHFLDTLEPELGTHVLLCQAVPGKHLTALAAKWLNKQNTVRKIQILKIFENQRPNLAAVLAQQWLETFSAQDAAPLQAYPAELVALSLSLASVEMHRLARRHAAQKTARQTAFEHAKNILIEQIGEAARAQLEQQNTSQALLHLKTIKALGPNKTHVKHLAKIVFEFYKFDQTHLLPEWFQEIFLPTAIATKPVYGIAAAILAQQHGDAELAQTCLRSAQEDSFDVHNLLPVLTKLLLSLNQATAAWQHIESAIAACPNRKDYIHQAIQMAQSAGMRDQTLRYLELMTAIEPTETAYFRQLAQLLAQNSLWQRSAAAREIVVQHQNDPLPEDLILLAKSALQAEQFQRAAEVGAQVLQQAPQNQEVQKLLAQAYVALDQLPQAQIQFENIVQQTPGELEAWLMLADIYEKTGQAAKQLEVLQTADQTIPNTPEILLKLGEAQLQLQTASAALHTYQKAYHLLQANPQAHAAIEAQVLLAYGKSLRQLGYLPEARQVLERAYQVAPQNAAIAYQFGKALYQIDQPQAALPVLEKALEYDPTNPAISLEKAKTLLAMQHNLEQAKTILIGLLADETVNHEAQAYLAEVYEASQEFELALESYRKAIKSKLSEDLLWLARLSEGLGRVALQLDQPETAIAAIKIAIQQNQDTPKLLKLLSQAYQHANLPQKALSTAQKVLQYNPYQPETLDWFVKRAITFDENPLAVTALTQAIENDPHQADPRIKLGWIHQYLGDFRAAGEQFETVLALENATPANLYDTGKGFLGINQRQNAIRALEKAIQVCENTATTENLPEYIEALVKIYQQQNDLQLALKTIQKALQYAPQNPKFNEAKIDILIAQNNLNGALAEAQTALQDFPNNANLDFQIARIYRLQRVFDKTHQHIQNALKQSVRVAGGLIAVPIAVFAADFAFATLDLEQARWIFERTEITAVEDAAILLKLYCLQGEIALEDQAEIAAANALTAALKIQKDHPRVLALQARIVAQQGNHLAAQQYFDQAIEMSGKIGIKTENKRQTTDVAATYLGVAEAAIQLNQWASAFLFLQKAVEISPYEPLPNFRMAKALVLQAEFQRVCEIINVTRHAPGKEATRQAAYNQFEDAILKAANQIAKLVTLQSEKTAQWFELAKETIAIWHGRGQAIFQPSREYARSLGKFNRTPDLHAAYISALRLCGDLETASEEADKALRHYANIKIETSLLAQIGITLARTQPEKAIRAIQMAIKTNAQRHSPQQPIFHGILAFIAHRIQNPDLHIQAITDALEGWPDEPQWLILAADLTETQSTSSRAHAQTLQYLSQAVQVEHQNDQLYIKYGAALAESNRTDEAIEAFETAARLAPTKTLPWISLANIYKTQGQPHQVIRCATKVIQIEPFHHQANLLLAEIHLQDGNTPKAIAFLDQILSQNSNHPAALILKSQAYAHTGKHTKALQSLERALPQLSDPIPAQLERIGLIEQSQGEAAALKETQALAEKYPQNALILTKLAEYLWHKGSHQPAIAAAQTAVNLAPDQLDQQPYLHLLQLMGKLMRSTGQLDQAIYFLSEAIQQDAENAELYLELGRCYRDRRQDALALEALQQSCALHPGHANAYFEAGLIYKDQKDFVNAEAMFRQAANLAPNNLNFHRQLGAVTAVNLVQNRNHQHQVINQTEPI